MDVVDFVLVRDFGFVDFEADDFVDLGFVVLVVVLALVFDVFRDFDAVAFVDFDVTAFLVFFVAGLLVFRTVGLDASFRLRIIISVMVYFLYNLPCLTFRSSFKKDFLASLDLSIPIRKIEPFTE